MDMLCGSDTVADIGCDHGRLSCALIQSRAAKRCIAIDISAPSLEKARALASFVGVSDRVETRLGDGFGPLTVGEADAIALLGMGGTLMARLLGGCTMPFHGARLVVLQPMRAVADIRRYLYETRCHITDDRIVSENGRLYQVFAAIGPQAAPQPLPDGWPADFFEAGFVTLAKRDPLLPAWLDGRLASIRKRLRTHDAPALIRQAAACQTIRQLWEDAT